MDCHFINTCLTVKFYLFSSLIWVLSIAGYGCNKVLDNIDIEFVNIYFTFILLQNVHINIEVAVYDVSLH